MRSKKCSENVLILSLRCTWDIMIYTGRQVLRDFTTHWADFSRKSAVNAFLGGVCLNAVLAAIYVCVYVHTCVFICIWYVYTYMHIYICICTYKHIGLHALRAGPPAPMNHVKTFKGWPLRDAPSELVQLWYKTFSTDHDGQVEMKNLTRLSNKTSTAWSCTEDQILKNKISGTGF